MAFGENSGLVGGGIGQGFAAGAQQGVQNYQQGVQMRKQDEDTAYRKTQDALNRQDRLDADKRNAAQNALNLKVQQFRELTPPPPPTSMNPDEWDQWNKDTQAWQNTRFSLAGDIDALMNVTVGEQKGPDGTPITMKSFSEVALGTSRADASAKLGQSTQNSLKLGELTKTLGSKITQLQAVAQAGGTTNNPEYDRLKGEVDGLEKEVSGLYTQVTGLKYTGQSVDYGAINNTAAVKGLSDVTTKSLAQFAENPIIGTILAASVGKNITFNTKLSDLGLQVPGTVGDAFKAARGEFTLGQALETGNTKQALAIYFSMTPEERSKDPQAQSLTAAIQDPNNTQVQSALAELKIPAAQVRQITASTVGQETANKRTWTQRAQEGDETLIGEEDAFIADLMGQGKTREQAVRAWQGIVKMLSNAGRKTEQEFTLRDQAITAGKTSENQNLAKLIDSGDLYLLDSAGAAGGIRDLFIKEHGTAEGERLYAQAIGRSQTNYELTADTRKVDFNTRVAQLRGINADNDFNELANPVRLSTLIVQRDTAQQQFEFDKAGNPIRLNILTGQQEQLDLQNLFDREGNPLKLEGLKGQNLALALQNAFDKAGNPIRLRTMGLQETGQALSNESARQQIAFDKAGNPIRLSLLKREDRARALQNAFDEKGNPLKLTNLQTQNLLADAEYERLQIDLRLMPKERQLALFARGAELGEAWLNSPQTKALAKEFGVDLGAFRTTAKFNDFVKTNSQRQAAWDEFKLLAANPRLALSQKGTL